MAVLTLKSTEKTLNDAKLSDNTGQANRTWPAEGAKVRLAHFTVAALAAANDITGTIELCNLPHGRVRVLPGMSHLNCSAFGAAATMDFGLRAYVASDGKTAVAEAGTDLVATKDMSAALTDSRIGASVKKDYFSATGLVVFATVRGAAMPAGATLEGYIAYEVIQ